MSSHDDQLITIKTVSHPHDVVVLRALLDGENIVNFLKDENTIQADPFYSNALGGVKLQVYGRDLERAIEIMEQGGFGSRQDVYGSTETGKENFTAKIPLLNLLPAEIRLVVFLGITITAAIMTLYCLTR